MSELPMTMSRTRLLAALGVAAPAVLFGMWLRGCTIPEPSVLTVVREIPSEELERKIQDLTIERDGLRARLEAVEAREPRIVYRDTTVYVEIPVPVCSEVVAVDDRGQLSAGVFSRVDGGWQRSMPTGIDVSDCDEGFSFGPEGVTCDRARFGHLDLALGARLVLPEQVPAGEIGLAWRPSYRSTWAVDALVTTRETFELRVRKGLRLW